MTGSLSALHRQSAPGAPLGTSAPTIDHTITQVPTRETKQSTDGLVSLRPRTRDMIVLDPLSATWGMWVTVGQGRLNWPIA